MSDALGDRIKSYEAVTTGRRVFRGQPFCIRLDGKAFHSFTRGLRRPYDERLTGLMVETTKHLVSEFGALVGYTQSDEITLGFFLPSGPESQYQFDGKLQKLESLSAAFATAYFNRLLPEYLPDKASQLPVFDSRAFAVPNLQELYHVFLWRQQDAVKNAISMAAQAHYSHKQLLGKNGLEKVAMLADKGVVFDEYPAAFRRGTFVRRVQRAMELSPEQLAKIPEGRRPDGPILRSVIEEHDYDLKSANQLWALLR